MGNSIKSLITVCCRSELTLDDLGDDILVEIFHRLPCKQALRSKFVSKRWNSLLSGPYFLRQFTSRWQYLFLLHDQHCSFVANSRQLLLVPNLPSESVGLMGPNLETALSCLNSLLASLPNKSLQSHQHVLGYSSGLLFLKIHHSDVHDFVVFDMITKQLIKLPLPPRLHPLSNYYFKGGLVCDRNHFTETVERAGVIKFFAVLVSRNMCSCYNDLMLQIYSSETGQWKSSTLVNCSRWMLVSPGVPYHGLLYFLCVHWGLMVCDPIHVTRHFIRLPNNRYRGNDRNPMKLDYYQQCIGVCCGTLRLCQATRLSHGSVKVMVWELRGFDKGTELGFWRLRHDVSLRPDTWSREYFTEPLAFHPYNGDVLYFSCGSSIFSCNLRSKTLEEMPVTGHSDCFERSMENTFPILVP